MRGRTPSWRGRVPSAYVRTPLLGSPLADRLLRLLGQVMRLLVNRSVFRESYYGSDIFANSRLSSVFLSAHEKVLRGVVGHWYV